MTLNHSGVGSTPMESSIYRNDKRIIEIYKELKLQRYVIDTTEYDGVLYDELLFLFIDQDPLTPITLWNHVSSFHGKTRELLNELEILTMGENS